MKNENQLQMKNDICRQETANETLGVNRERKITLV